MDWQVSKGESEVSLDSAMVATKQDQASRPRMLKAKTATTALSDEGSLHRSESFGSSDSSCSQAKQGHLAAKLVIPKDREAGRSSFIRARSMHRQSLKMSSGTMDPDEDDEELESRLAQPRRRTSASGRLKMEQQARPKLVAKAQRGTGEPDFDSFEDLLSRLRDEHYREVELLKASIEAHERHSSLLSAGVVPYELSEQSIAEEKTTISRQSSPRPKKIKRVGTAPVLGEKMRNSPYSSERSEGSDANSLLAPMGQQARQTSGISAASTPGVDTKESPLTSSLPSEEAPDGPTAPPPPLATRGGPAPPEHASPRLDEQTAGAAKLTVPGGACDSPHASEASEGMTLTQSLSGRWLPIKSIRATLTKAFTGGGRQPDFVAQADVVAQVGLEGSTDNKGEGRRKSPPPSFDAHKGEGRRKSPPPSFGLPGAPNKEEEDLQNSEETEQTEESELTPRTPRKIGFGEKVGAATRSSIGAAKEAACLDGVRPLASSEASLAESGASPGDLPRCQSYDLASRASGMTALSSIASGKQAVDTEGEDMFSDVMPAMKVNSNANSRPLPRIAGLKRGNSILKGSAGTVSAMKSAGSKKKSVAGMRMSLAAVMFDESAADKCRDSEPEQEMIKVKPIWSQGPSNDGRKHDPSGAKMMGRKSAFVKKGSTDSQVVAEVEKEATRMDRLVSHPNSVVNFYCDVVSIVCICYDVVMIPLGVFPIKETSAGEAVRMFTSLFWTLDLFRHFFKGHYSQGNVIMVWRRVAVKYLLTWAVLDTILVVADWIEWIIKLTDSNQTAGVSRLLRIMRNIRSVRLLRGVKTAHILKLIEDRIQSEALGVCWTTIKLLICILFANHLSACMWYWLGTLHDADEPGWHELYLHSHPRGNTLAYMYLTSFHWAITQFTPASIKIQPENTIERAFAIFILLTAFVSMSTFISGLTSAVMQLRQLSSVKHKQFWLLRKYLNEAGVPTKLAVRINNYCEHAWISRSKRLQEKNIELLMLLSMSLRAELKETIFAPRFSKHAFFMLLQTTAPTAVRSLCSTAVSQIELGRADDLFLCGEDAHHMFFVEKGKLTYKFFEEGPGELVRHAHWVCEACLWTSWVYRGTLTGVLHSTSTAIDSAAFSKVVGNSAEARLEAVKYASSFVQGINREPQWKLSDLYMSSMIEGIWFRLLKEYQITRNGQSSAGGSVRQKKIGMGMMSNATYVRGASMVAGLKERFAKKDGSSWKSDLGRVD